jgi:hypothetical protein
MLQFCKTDFLNYKLYLKEMRIYEKQGIIDDELTQNNPSADYAQRWEGN